MKRSRYDPIGWQKRSRYDPCPEPLRPYRNLRNACAAGGTSIFRFPLMILVRREDLKRIRRCAAAEFLFLGESELVWSRKVCGSREGD